VDGGQKFVRTGNSVKLSLLNKLSKTNFLKMNFECRYTPDGILLCTHIKLFYHAPGGGMT